MNKDELLQSKIEDCIRRCSNGMYITTTKFLDAHEQAIAGTIVRNSSDCKTLFYGGYPDAERRLLVCIPRDLGVEDKEACEGLVKVLHIETAKGSRKLGHRDYLGSVLSLGLDRSVTGDILVREDGADMIILPEMEDFLLSEYTKAAHTELKTSICNIEQLTIPERRTQTIRDTVPSERLDNVVSSAFKISRAQAAKAINTGLVSVNHMESTKIDLKVAEGNTLVLRGKGKAFVSEIGGESKKGRIWISIERYVD